MRAMKDRRLHFFSEAAAIEYFEGDIQSIQRPNEPVDKSEFQTIEERWTLTKEQAENLSIAQLLEQVDRIATSLGSQQVKHILATVDKGVEKVGHTIQHGITIEEHANAYLTSLDTIYLDFNDDGMPRLPSIIAGTEAAVKLKAAQEYIQSNDKLLARYDEIITRQRERWRARESNRKLVG